MGRRKSELAELDHLARKVWGDNAYQRVEQVRAARAARRARIRDVTAIALGAPLIVLAAGLVLLPAAAYAHTSAIDISCTEVDFHYQSFGDASTTAHETIMVDGSTVVERDFTVTTSDVTDAVALSLGAGTHVVDANDSWSSTDGGGSAQAEQTLSDCAPGETTTSTVAPGTTASPSTSSSTSTSPSTTVASTTSVVPTTTVPPTTVPPTTPTTAGSTTSTATTPVTGLGSTSTTTVVATTTGPSSSPTTNAPVGNPLPFTGSSRTPPAIALALVGSGLVAMGIGGRRRPSRSR
jgi:hypothetical protein